MHQKRVNSLNQAVHWTCGWRRWTSTCLRYKLQVVYLFIHYREVGQEYSHELSNRLALWALTLGCPLSVLDLHCESKNAILNSCITIAYVDQFLAESCNCIAISAFVIRCISICLFVCRGANVLWQNDWSQCYAYCDQTAEDRITLFSLFSTTTPTSYPHVKFDEEIERIWFRISSIISD